MPCPPWWPTCTTLVARFMPRLTGSVTLADLDTSAPVLFGFDYRGSYTVTFGPVEALTGAPPAGAFEPALVDDTESGFTLAVAAAPGGGASVVVPYVVVPGSGVGTLGVWTGPWALGT